LKALANIVEICCAKSLRTECSAIW